MIKKEEVEKISKLARLSLNEEEKEIFSKDLSSIFDYIEMLKKVDIEGVETTSHVHEVKNIMRDDFPLEEEEEIRENMLKMVPYREGNYIKVKTILK